MARSPYNAKLLASSIAGGLSLSIFRRGHTAAAPREWVSGGFIKGGPPSLMGKVADGSSVTNDKEDPGASSSWAPDPITGYYRPANRAAEIDPVELRELLLNHRVRSR